MGQKGRTKVAMRVNSPVLFLAFAAMLGMFLGFGLVIGAFVARALRGYMTDERFLPFSKNGRDDAGNGGK